MRKQKKGGSGGYLTVPLPIAARRRALFEIDLDPGTEREVFTGDSGGMTSRAGERI